MTVVVVVVAAAAAAAQATGKTAAAAGEVDSAPFAHRNRTRKKFYFHANKSDRRRRTCGCSDCTENIQLNFD